MKVSFLENFLSCKVHTDKDAFSEVSTDTRSMKKDALFIALKGENFDGNTYAKEAIEKGALAAIVDEASLHDSDKNIIFVEDCRTFLKDFGRAWAEHTGAHVVGVTGSNGKTTTKYFLSQMLSPFKKVCFSPKSFNNSIGVPFAQLMLKEEDEVLISEIGTNAPGEIKDLTLQTRPYISMVTTVGESHLERFKTVENVAIEKEDMYKHSSQKIGLFNLDNKFTEKMYETYKKIFEQTYTLSTKEKEADFYAEVKNTSLKGLEVEGAVFKEPFKVSLPVIGEHNVYNFLFALATGVSLGVESKKLLEAASKNLKTPWGRTQIYKDETRDVTFLFDGYNANLQSVAALKNIISSENPDKLHIVVGEMLELGEEREDYHAQLGALMGAVKPKSLFFVGLSHLSFREGVESVGYDKNLVISNTYDKSLANKLESMLDNGDTVVLKASRGTKIESFMEDLNVDFERL